MFSEMPFPVIWLVLSVFIYLISINVGDEIPNSLDSRLVIFVSISQNHCKVYVLGSFKGQINRKERNIHRTTISYDFNHCTLSL